MEIQNLKYFIAIAEQLSFTKAAKQLYVSQPTLSRHINNLEKKLNIQLFKRIGQNIELSTEGKWFLGESKKIISQIEALEKQADQVRDGHIGTVNIGYSGNVGHLLLSQTLNSLHKNHPNLEIYIERRELGYLKEMLEANTIDLMFNLEIGLEKYSDIISKKIISNNLMAIVPKNHPLAKRKYIHLADLANEKFILLDRNASNLTMDTFTHLCIEHDFFPKIIRYPENLQSACVYVEAGLGVSLVSSEIQKLNLYNVAFLPLKDIDINYNIVVAWMRYNQNPALSLFIKELNKFI